MTKITNHFEFYASITIALFSVIIFLNTLLNTKDLFICIISLIILILTIILTSKTYKQWKNGLK